jgi:hypothetical protein
MIETLIGAAETEEAVQRKRAVLKPDVKVYLVIHTQNDLS